MNTAIVTLSVAAEGSTKAELFAGSSLLKAWGLAHANGETVAVINDKDEVLVFVTEHGFLIWEADIE